MSHNVLRVVNELLDTSNDFPNPLYAQTWQERERYEYRPALDYSELDYSELDYSELDYELRRNEQHIYGAIGEERSRASSTQRQAEFVATSSPSLPLLDPSPTRENRYQPGFSAPSFGLPVPHLTEQSFLQLYPSGNATISFYNAQNKLESMSGLNVELIAKRLPMLGFAFEETRSGPQLYLEVLNSNTAWPFVRFLYTGTYALSGGLAPNIDEFQDVPTSVLLHCQLYRLGDMYDLLDLRKQAYVNVVRQCEFGCSSPDKPIDLCAAIQYIYQHLHMPEHENLIDTIINYCVSCFLRHNLAADPDFQRVAYESRPFNQGLCKNVMSRRHEGDIALAIIQMPFKRYSPDTYASREDVDSVYHFHADDHLDRSPTEIKRQKRVKEEENFATASSSLALRLCDLKKPRHITGGLVEELRVVEAANASHLKSIDVAQVNAARDAAQDPASSNEFEFEVIQRPSQNDAGSNSDSESGEFVKVEREDVNEFAHELPIRTRPSEIQPVDAANGNASDSDSEWTLL